jgi:hypothetical protein
MKLLKDSFNSKDKTLDSSSTYKFYNTALKTTKNKMKNSIRNKD